MTIITTLTTTLTALLTTTLTITITSLLLLLLEYYPTVLSPARGALVVVLRGVDRGCEEGQVAALVPAE